MRLSAVPILSFNSVNSYSYGSQWIIRAGDINTTLYFQIVDLDQGPQSSIGNPANPIFSLNFNNPGIRYMVGIGSINQPFNVMVTFPSNAAALNTFVTQTAGFIPYLSTTNFPAIDPTQVFNLNAVQADPNDASIWKVSLPANIVPNSGTVQFTVMEGNATRRFGVNNMLNVEQINQGNC